MKDLENMKTGELVKLYKIEENEEMKSLILVQILKRMENYIYSYLSKEYKFLLSKEYKEDVVQECEIAVLECLEKFNPFNGTHFITYAYLPIKQKIHVFIEKNIYKDSSYNQKKYGKVEFLSFDDKLDLFLSEKRFEEDSVRKLEILDLVNNLNGINRFILIQFYINQESIKNISQKLGITEKAVKKRKKNSLEKLRKLI